MRGARTPTTSRVSTQPRASTSSKSPRYDGFHGTPVESYLRVEGVETTVPCGFTTNVCVESTARGAHERGFDVVLVEDCCASFSPAMHESALRNAELMLGTTATAEQVAELLGDAS